MLICATSIFRSIWLFFNSFLRETCLGGSQLSLPLRQIARNKILSLLVCSSLVSLFFPFSENIPYPTGPLPVCFLVLSLDAVVFFDEAGRI